MSALRPGSLEGVGLAAIERIAAELLGDDAYAYFSAGARDEWTMRANRAAWSSWCFVPRALVDTSRISVATTVLGHPAALPIIVAPMAAQRLAHPGGELETAQAAADAGCIMVVSTSSNTPIETIAAVTGSTLWFQLYASRDRSRVGELVARVTAAGAKAIVLTVDSVLDRSTHRRPHGELRFAPDLPFPMRDDSPIEDRLDWDYVEWLRDEITVPLVLKGIVDPDDARRAAGLGCAAVIVSNHGGRQLDGAVPTAEILPEVVDAVGDGAEIYVDGGIQRGADVLRALALGAHGVLVGRPILWGLAAAGRAGVAHVLDVLRTELVDDARQCGVVDLAAVPPSVVRRVASVAIAVPPAAPLRGR